jgi:Zn-dependent protease with chaperone function
MWAGLAIILVVFSYVFTFLLVAACVYLPFLSLSASPGANSLIVFLAGVVVGVVILWSLLPRRDTFHAPGPRIDADRHPRLFAELTSIARALNEPVPLEVYAIPDVNAWVAERGGTMGFGSRRVMGLGLPLLGILTISQFRAVLAHEFAHYYGGDTRLWPFVHKTRAAMARTLRNLGSDSLAQAFARINLARLVHYVAVTVLVAYWNLFLRITQAISRLHEYRADELASNIAGSQALIDGLSTIHGASAALPMFWRTEMLPAMEAGYRPSFADGFVQFIVVPKIAAAVAAHVSKELQEATTDPYDTHPPLKDRVAALRLYPDSHREADATPAITLLDSLDGIEFELLQKMAPQRKLSALKSVSWDRIGPDAYLPKFRQIVQESAPVLGNNTIERLPELVANLNDIAQRLRDPVGMLLTRGQRIERVAQLLSTVLTVALCDSDWYFHASPGQFYLEHDGHRIVPDEIVAQIRSGAMTTTGWIEQCKSLGISGVSLSPLPPL